jgi:P4 family phage/plasmid primase-like protien
MMAASNPPLLSCKSQPLRKISMLKHNEISSLIPSPMEWLDPTSTLIAWRRKWPSPILYEHRHGAKSAALFMARRMPRLLISSQGILFSLTEEGVWQNIAESKIAAEISQTDHTTFLDVNNIKRMIESIHQQCAAPCAPFEWIHERKNDPAASDLMLFRNGRYDVARGHLTPHDGRYFATETPAFDLDPEASCPLWCQSLDQWMSKDDQDTLHEFLGYLMTGDTSLQKMLVMLGPPRSGKSTVMSVIQQICGSATSVSRTLADLCGDFGLNGIQGKRLLLIPDAHDATAERHNIALNRIKSITGEDRLSVNRKHKDIESIKLSVRLVISANRHPKFIDESGALAAREIVIPFLQEFKGQEDHKLGSKLTGELSGIANLAVRGLRRLRKNGNHFKRGATSEIIAQQIREDQSPAFAFAEAALRVTRDDDDFLPDWMLQKSYNGYCNMQGIAGRSKRSINQLKSDLETALGAGVRRTQRRGKNQLGAETGLHGLAGIASAIDIEGHIKWKLKT